MNVVSGHGNDELKQKVQVLDFNPYAARRVDELRQSEMGEGAGSEGMEVESESRVVSATTRMLKGHIFREDVESFLPYREITKCVPYRSFSPMIDDERILFLTVSQKIHDFTTR